MCKVCDITQINTIQKSKTQGRGRVTLVVRSRFLVSCHAKCFFYYHSYPFEPQTKKKSTFYKRISDYDDLDKMKVSCVLIVLRDLHEYLAI